MINIRGMEKAAVLAALYNSAHVQGLGIFQAIPGIMSIEEARQLLKSQTYFDYVFGRVMKVNLSGDEFEERLYDRDNGNGAAWNALSICREKGGGNER
jgi:hypothetical protein